MSMRILGLAQVPLGRHDGASAHVIGLYSELARSGAEVRCILPGILPASTPLPFQTIYVPTGRDIRKWTFIWHLLSPWWFLGAVLRYRPQVVYLRGHLLLPHLVLARLLGRPAAVEVNEDKSGELEWQGEWRRRLARLNRIIERWSYRLAWRLLPVTPQLRDLLVHEHGVEPARCRVVSNGLDPAVFFPRPKEEAKRYLGLDARRRYIAFVSQLTPRHSLDLLAQGFAELAGQVPDVDLLVVGEGVARPQMMRWCEELGIGARVIFAGEVPAERAAWYIAAAECGVAQLRADRNARRVGASPLKLWAYLGCARPVLAGQVPNLAEIIREWDCGLIIEEETPAAFAAAARYLLEHPDKAEEMGQRGYAGALAGYTWHAVAQKTLAIFEEALHAA
ncbi:MAG: glycosyltransferase [Anaerolineae bacterium]|nr:glycosyltransferase [Anaerolineae bacterium]